LSDDNHWISPAGFAKIEGLQHQVVSFEQKLGEMVIVPPNAPHCVLNQGGLTFAVAGNTLDHRMAVEALKTEVENQQNRVKTIYKVRGAIWGTMLKLHQANKPLPYPIRQACAQIIELEEQGLKLGSFCKTDEKLSKLALEYKDCVTCDHCDADIFNAYLQEVRVGSGGAMTSGKDFCLSELCKNAAVEHVDDAFENLRLICPKSIKELQFEFMKKKAI
jgi:hypothetical protein